MSTVLLESLLRVYRPSECGPDGYPFAWHRESSVASDGRRLPVNHLAVEQPTDTWLPIKDVIRELAGHRCLRCGHPYPPGITDTCPRGEWTPCDEGCSEHPAEGTRLVDNAGVVIAEGRGGAIAVISDLGYTPVEPMHYEAHWRILTVHHLNEDKADCRWWNLAALCQRCHLRMQRAVVMGRPYHFEHSEWFKPYAAGFYAWKYEGMDLTREETMERLDDLLAWELRFRQEGLL